MEIKVISHNQKSIEEKVKEFIINNKDKEIVDIHFTQYKTRVNAFIILKEKSLQKLTNEEVRILKALVFDSLSMQKGSGGNYGILYTLKKLKEYGVVDFYNEDNVRVCMWAKPKFMFEYIFNKEQQNIVMLLKKEGELKQIDISNKTRIPRTTVTRRLEELERMDVIKRRLEGPSKNVKLSEWFQDNF